MDEYLVKETIEALKIHLNEYLNTVWKTFAALMVAIGWLISSEDALRVVSGNKHIRHGALTIVVFLAILHFATLADLYRKSSRARNSLGDEIEGLLLSVLETYSIPVFYPIVSFFINGSLYTGLIPIIQFGVK